MSENTADQSGPMPGTIGWTEIPVRSIERAQKFYSAVFGWEFSAVPGTNPSEHETVVFARGPTRGSLIQVDGPNHLSPALHPDNKDKNRVALRVTIVTESADEALKAVEENNGKVYLPVKEIGGNMGKVGYFTDTEENVMGVWSMN